jgi:hypothetical protein
VSVDTTRYFYCTAPWASGVQGLLIFCADYHCSHSMKSAAINDPTMSGYPILSRDWFVKAVEIGEQM